MEVNTCCKAVAQRLVDRAGLTGKIGAIVTSFGASQDVAGANLAAVNAIDNNNAKLLTSAAGIAFLGVVSGGMFNAGAHIYSNYKKSLGDDAASQALFDEFLADPEAAKGVLEGFNRPSNNDDDNDETFQADENAGKAKILATPVNENTGKGIVFGTPYPDVKLAKDIAILAMSYLELNPLSSILMNKSAQKDLATGKPLSDAEKARAQNSADALRLRTELALKGAGILDEKGTLTKKALSESKELRLADGKIGNPDIVAELKKDGSEITDWKKYTTAHVENSSGQKLQIHYYRNIKTEKIDYKTQDYKVNQEVK